MAALASLHQESSVEGSFLDWSLPVAKDVVSAYQHLVENESEAPPLMCLGAVVPGHIPARYTIRGVPDHVFPAVGVYVDTRILPGFQYKIKVLPYETLKAPHYLFGGSALQLTSIGRGYSRRLVFAPSTPQDLYNCEFEEDEESKYTLWADSNPGGVALELQVIFEGYCFHVLNNNGVFVGDCKVLQVLEPQEQLSQKIEKGCVSKTVKVSFECLVRWLDLTKKDLKVVLSSVVVCERKGREMAKISSPMSVRLDGLDFELTPTVPGYQSVKVTEDQTVHGLLDGEYPVIGNHADPRILTGFTYNVRQLSDGKLLFECPLRLLSTQEGNKFVFQGPLENFVLDAKYSKQGFGFQPVAVMEGEVFQLVSDENTSAGIVEIVRIASRQKEISRTLTESAVEVDLVCRHLVSTFNTSSTDLLRVRGVAFVSRSLNPSAQPTSSLTSIRNLSFLRTSSNLLRRNIKDSKLQLVPL